MQLYCSTPAGIVHVFDARDQALACSGHKLTPERVFTVVENSAWKWTALPKSDELQRVFSRPYRVRWCIHCISIANGPLFDFENGTVVPAADRAEG